MKSAASTTTRNRTFSSAASKPVAVPVSPVVGRNFPLVLGGGDSLGMVWCPPTSPEGFRMGSLESELGRQADERAHQVILTKGFWLGRTQVTQAQWTAIMGTENPSHFKGVNRPVEYVSWNDAIGFCQKLALSERVAGRIPEGYEYTLPTEAQWEYACRAGTTYEYSQLLDATGWYHDNSDDKTHTVALKQANPWGLHDMHGNVDEWCSDWYDGDYSTDPITDPIGPPSGSLRVVRGGSWFDEVVYCRGATRGSCTPLVRNNGLGLRLALAPQIGR